MPFSAENKNVEEESDQERIPRRPALCPVPPALNPAGADPAPALNGAPAQ